MTSADPTHTQTVRTRYGQRLRGQLGHLNAAIRDGIIEDDVFFLQNENPEQPSQQQPYQFPTDQGQIRAFMDWFRKQVQKGFLSVVDPRKNVFIQAAYEQGVKGARAKLTVEGPEPDFELPAHKRALRELFTRNYKLLREVSDDMARDVRDSLVEGLRDGHHSSKIAREITNRVDKVGKHRATLIARTEVINAYSEGSLHQYEQVDVEGVTVQSELLTAQDDRVCDLCEAIADMGAFSLSEMRTKTLKLHGQVVNPKPPIHPRCRCTIIPVTEGSATLAT